MDDDNKPTPNEPKRTKGCFLDDNWLAARMAWLDQESDRMDRRLKANEEQMGAFSDGTILEEDVFDTLKESRTICGMPLDYVEHDVKSLRGDQFDIVGTNGKCMVVIEVKRTLKKADIMWFAKDRLPVFKRAFASDIGKKKVLGVMVYRRSNEKVRRVALDNGLLLVHSVGKKKLNQVKN